MVNMKRIEYEYQWYRSFQDNFQLELYESHTDHLPWIESK